MAEGTPRTITIAQVDKRVWQKPNSEQIWHTIVVEGHTSEPIKFIQDKSKDAPAPEEGKTYSGRVYMGNNGYKFYPDVPRQPKTSNGSRSGNYTPRDDEGIRAQFAIKTAVALLKNPEADIVEDTIEHWAKVFYKMVDRVKGEVVAISNPTVSKDDVFDTVPESDEDMKSLMSNIPF